MEIGTEQASVGDCAHEVLDVVPLVSRVIRGELRKHGAKGISEPQYRSLAFVFRNEGASLSELSDHIGLALPTMSSLIDGLVERGLVNRRTDPEDRRRMTLTLTSTGRVRLESARSATMTYLEQRFRQLSASDRTTITLAMRTLKELFTGVKEHAEH